MEDPKPTIGRIVIYHPTGYPDVPAVVVSIEPSDQDVLGLHVMFGPSFMTSKGESAGGGCLHFAKVTKGDAPGQWGWPPRMPQL